MDPWISYPQMNSPEIPILGLALFGLIYLAGTDIETEEILENDETDSFELTNQKGFQIDADFIDQSETKIVQFESW